MPGECRRMGGGAQGHAKESKAKARLGTAVRRKGYLIKYSRGTTECEESKI